MRLSARLMDSGVSISRANVLAISSKPMGEWLAFVCDAPCVRAGLDMGLTRHCALGWYPLNGESIKPVHSGKKSFLLQVVQRAFLYSCRVRGWCFWCAIEGKMRGDLAATKTFGGVAAYGLSGQRGAANSTKVGWEFDGGAGCLGFLAPTCCNKFSDAVPNMHRKSSTPPILGCIHGRVAAYMEAGSCHEKR